MISWIQKTFQAHFKLVFALLLIAMVVPLVFIYSASGGIGSADHETRTITAFGVTIKSDEHRRLDADTNVSLQLKYGRMLYYVAQQMDLSNYLFYRAAALEMADKLGLPRATPQDVKDFIQTRRGFAGQDGKFDPQLYQQIVDGIQADPRGDRGQLARVLADDWRIASVERLLGGPGYVLDSELKQMLARADTKWSVSVATLDLSKVPASREPTEEELRQWFDQKSGNYRIPDRSRVKYVEFRGEDFLSKVSLSDGDVAQYFEANKSRYQKPAPPPTEGQPPAAPVVPTLADVREQVQTDLQRQRAAQLAAKAANDFAYALYRDTKEGTPPAEETFVGLATAANVAIKSPEPFTVDQPPAGTGWRQTILAQAAQLNEKHPVSDALPNGDSTVLLFFVERLPSYVPDFSVARERVLADVKEDLRQKAISTRGEELQRKLTDVAKSGGSFVDAAKAAGLETKAWENFTMRTPPQDFDYAVANQLEERKVNEVSPMTVVEARGIITLVTNRQVPEVSTTGEQYEQARRSTMESFSQVAGRDVLDEIVKNGLTAAGIARNEER